MIRMREICICLILAATLTGCGPSPEPPTALPATAVPTSQPTRSPAEWPLADGRWQSYTTADGLPHNTIRALALDQSGRLWVGTDGAGGLFDGVNFQTIVPWPLPLMEVAFDAQGRAWLADGLGVEVLENGTLTSYAEHLSSVQSEDLLVDNQGWVWVAFSSGSDADGGGGGGIDVYDGTTWRHYGVEDGLFGSTVLGLAEDPAGQIWAVGEQGFARFDGSAWEAALLPDQPETQAITCVAADPAGRIWFGTSQLGLWVLDGTEWTHYDDGSGLAGNTVWAIVFDSAGRAWIGTSAGLNVFDGQTWFTYTTAEGLIYNDVREIALVEDGAWVGTWRGLSRLTFSP